METKKGKQAIETPPKKEQPTQSKPTHALLDVDLFDAVYNYIFSKPMGEVEQLILQIRSRTELVTLPKEEKPKEK